MLQTNSSLPEGLARLERRLETLRSLQALGRLSPAQYQEEIQTLTATDEQGRNWWLAGQTGAWHWWDGHAWVPGQPARMPAGVSKPSGAARVEAKVPARRMGLFVALGCAALVMVCVIAGGVFLGGGYAEYRALPKIVEDIQVDTVAASPLLLSSEQQQVRAEMGEPEAFLILFYEEMLEDGSTGDVRTETWSYYTQGVEYTFINGELVGEDSMGVEVGQLESVPYTPEQFQAYMDLGQVIAVAGLDSFLVVPLEKELVPGGEVYYADQLTFGLRDDQLRYVEALALAVEG